MDIKELKIKSDQEINHLLAESRTKLDALRFKVAQNQLKGVREIRVIRKTIARILTLVRQRKDSHK